MTIVMHYNCLNCNKRQLWFYGSYHMMWPFKWNIFSSTFPWCLAELNNVKFGIFLTPWGKEKEGLQEIGSAMFILAPVRCKINLLARSIAFQAIENLYCKLHKTALFQRQIELIIINLGFQTTLKQKAKSPGARPNYKEKRQTAVWNRV